MPWDSRAWLTFDVYFASRQVWIWRQGNRETANWSRTDLGLDFCLGNLQRRSLCIQGVDQWHVSINFESCVAAEVGSHPIQGIIAQTLVLAAAALERLTSWALASPDFSEG